MIVELNNDANYIIVAENNRYCLKCGKPINVGKFCDSDCRREYYEEIKHDLGGFLFKD